MKKFLAMLLALVMVMSLVACGSKPAETTAPAASNPAESTPVESTPETTAPAASGAELKVAMVTDSGDITDQSFNQTTYEAGKAWCDENGVSFTYFKPVGEGDADRVAMIDAAVANGYNVLLLPGYLFAPAIAQTVELYPDVKFVALDVAEFDLMSAGLTEIPANLYSAVYQEELSGYMAGYAAVKLGYRKLGYLGGMAVPAVQRFGYGWLQGVEAAAAELGCTADITMEWAYGNQFFGDADITAVMDTWYTEKGVECVFACGGGIFTSAAEAAAKVGGKVVGVDSDQAPVIDGTYGEGMTITSAMKGLAPTVKTLLTEIQAGNFANYGGQVMNMGLVSEVPADNYVQLAPSTHFTEGQFTEADYNALVAAMFNGEVVVSGDIEAMPAVSYTVNDYGNLK